MKMSKATGTMSHNQIKMKIKARNLLEYESILKTLLKRASEMLDHPYSADSSETVREVYQGKYQNE